MLILISTTESPSDAVGWGASGAACGERGGERAQPGGRVGREEKSVVVKRFFPSMGVDQ